MELETPPTAEQVDVIHQQLQLLAHASLPLVDCIVEALQYSATLLARVNRDRSFFRSKEVRSGKQFEAENARIVQALDAQIELYKKTTRLEVLEPFKV